MRIRMKKTYHGGPFGEEVSLYPGRVVEGQLAEYVHNLRPDWCERLDDGAPAGPAGDGMTRPTVLKGLAEERPDEEAAPIALPEPDSEPEGPFYCGAPLKSGDTCRRQVSGPGERCYLHDGN